MVFQDNNYEIIFINLYIVQLYANGLACRKLSKIKIILKNDFLFFCENGFSTSQSQIILEFGK